MTDPDDHIQDLPPNRAGKGGRPKCGVSGANVRQLRDQGRSWRQIAEALRIGTATAMRLYQLDTVPKPSQNPGGGG
jgi:hypothetical protein